MLGAQIGSGWEGPTCVGMQGADGREGVLSWVHMAKGTTKRLFLLGRDRRRRAPSGLEHQGQEDFGFSTESTGNPARYGAWRGVDSSWAGGRGYSGLTDVGSGMGVCMSTDGFPVYTVTGTGRERQSPRHKAGVRALGKGLIQECGSAVK